MKINITIILIPGLLLLREEPPVEKGGASFLKIHIPGSVGLYMRNKYGIHNYHSLNVMFYKLTE